MSAMTKLVHSQIQGGVMPITGAGDAQLHHLMAEVQRLTRERDEARAELAEFKQQHEWLRQTLANIGCREDAEGNLVRTV